MNALTTLQNRVSSHVPGGFSLLPGARRGEEEQSSPCPPFGVLHRWSSLFSVGNSANVSTFAASAEILR